MFTELWRRVISPNLIDFIEATGPMAIMAAPTQTDEIAKRKEMLFALDHSVALYEASKVQKLCRIGARIGYSGLLARLARKPRRKQARLFWGDDMTVVLPENVSMSIYRYGFFEGDVSHMLLETLHRGMTFYDIGAHFGYFTCLASELVGPQGHVHSFEPTPSTFEILGINGRKRPNVQLNNAAVFSTNSQLTFQDFGVRYSAFNSAVGSRLDETMERQATAKSYQVEAVTVDEYARRTGNLPDVVKIDAENAEYDVLMGMEQTLQESKPTVSIEVGDMGKDSASGGSARVVQFLQEHGYRAFEWLNGALRTHIKRAGYEYGNLLFRHPDNSN